MFSPITGVLTFSHMSTSYEPKKNLLPSFSPDNESIYVDFVIQEIGGAEGDRWRCRRLFYAVPLKALFNCLITLII